MTIPPSTNELEAIRKGYDADPARSLSLRAEAYTEPRWHQLDLDQIIAKTWQWVCHVEKVRKPGSFVTIEIAGKPFLTYIATQLAPCLAAGDIVVMDNLSTHKVEGVRKLIEARGASLLYLPPYSPDFNPIEMVFAKLKALLRKAAERTEDALCERIGQLLDTFTPHECSNYLRHAGYDRT